MRNPIELRPKRFRPAAGSRFVSRLGSRFVSPRLASSRVPVPGSVSVSVLGVSGQSCVTPWPWHTASVLGSRSGSVVACVAVVCHGCDARPPRFPVRDPVRFSFRWFPLGGRGVCDTHEPRRHGACFLSSWRWEETSVTVNGPSYGSGVELGGAAFTTRTFASSLGPGFGSVLGSWGCSSSRLGVAGPRSAWSVLLVVLGFACWGVGEFSVPVFRFGVRFGFRFGGRACLPEACRAWFVGCHPRRVVRGE